MNILSWSVIAWATISLKISGARDGMRLMGTLCLPPGPGVIHGKAGRGAQDTERCGCSIWSRHPEGLAGGSAERSTQAKWWSWLSEEVQGVIQERLPAAYWVGTACG